jgi:hypothetical protein
VTVTVILTPELIVESKSTLIDEELSTTQLETIPLFVNVHAELPKVNFIWLGKFIVKNESVPNLFTMINHILYVVTLPILATFGLTPKEIKFDGLLVT